MKLLYESLYKNPLFSQNRRMLIMILKLFSHLLIRHKESTDCKPLNENKVIKSSQPHTASDCVTYISCKLSPLGTPYNYFNHNSNVQVLASQKSNKLQKIQDTE